MSGGNEYEEFVKRHIGVPMNIHQATKFQEILDKMPTNTNMNLQWVNCKTKQPISFGCSSIFNSQNPKVRN